MQIHIFEHNRKPVYSFTLKNNKGMWVVVTNYGCKIISVNVPDKHGMFTDVVLGYDTVEEYISGNRYFGAIIGRCTNRIEQGLLNIDDKTYSLTCNDGDNHLHGGLIGFDSVVWNVYSYSDNEIVFSYMSTDGEEGYPGNLKVNVTYKLTDNNSIHIDYSATTDKSTAINLTNHTFFNLNGVNRVGFNDITNHSLIVSANRYTVNNKYTIPTGDIVCVEGTILDMRNETELLEVIKQTGGLDHNYIIDDLSDKSKSVTSLYSKDSGIRMNVYSTKPCVQIYSGNFLDGSDIGKAGISYDRYSGICIETQGYPDGNRLNTFCDNTLRCGELYEHKTVFEFTIE